MANSYLKSFFAKIQRVLTFSPASQRRPGARVGKRFKELKFQFIFYAIASTFLPLTAIITGLLVYQVSMFNTEAESKVRRSYKMFQQNLNTVESRLNDRALLFATVFSKKGMYSRQELDEYFQDTIAHSTFRFVEFFFRDGESVRYLSEQAATTFRAMNLNTTEEKVREYRETVSSPLFDLDATFTDRYWSQKMLLFKCSAVIFNDAFEHMGLCVLTHVIDDAFCSRIKLLSGAEVIIYKKGLPLVSSLFTANEAVEDARLQQYDGLLERLREEELAFDNLELLGKQYLAGFFPLFYKNEVIGLAAVAHDRSEFEASVWTAAVVLLAALFFSLLIIVFSGFYLSRKTLTPVFNLVQATRKLAQGELDIRIKEKPENELGELTESFNTMAETIKTHQDIMENYNVILKEEIEHRSEELRKAQRMIVHTEKMASLGELTAGIAHEIKNPLNFIKNFAESNIEYVEELQERLKKQLDDSEDTEEKEELEELLKFLAKNNQTITDESMRITSIIQGMLNQSRGDSNIKERYNINTLVQESAHLVYHSFRATRSELAISVDEELADEPLFAMVNPAQLNRAFVNILNNAAYAVEKRKKQEEEGAYIPTIVVRTTKKAGDIIVTIEDNGTGIPEHVRDKIFEPFFTTKETQQGTGLGLKICYDIIVDGHGGTIEVATRENAYTRFEISIPGSNAEESL